MATSALDICESAYRQANLDQTLSSFSMTDFPYSIAQDLLNTVIQEMNRKGAYWFTETSADLTYSGGVYQYTFSSVASDLDPKRILRLRKESTNHKQELIQMNWRRFQERYRRDAVQTGEPLHWAKYGNSLELSTIPDQDYTIKVYYLRDMPLVTATTDTLLCQVGDEDVFREGVYAYLLDRLGRPDAQAKMAAYLNKVGDLLADMKQDSGIALQIPAAF